MSSTKIDLRRARIVEFNRSDGKGWQLTVIRIGHGASFRVMAINSDPDHRGVGNVWTEQEIQVHGASITVLAEFPLTLADLLPEGCTAFKFKRLGGRHEYLAWLQPDTDLWEVGGADFRSFGLDQLADHHRVDLSTVIPLELRTHPDWIEAQR